MDYETNKIISQEELNKMGEELSNYAESLINQQFKKISNDMDYEKKYKDAQKWIESLYPNLSHEQQMEAEAFFPELVESEDEKVKKEIIEHCKNTRCVTEEGAERIAKWIAWLEKQDERKPQRMVSAEAKEAIYGKPAYAWSEEDDKMYNSLTEFEKAVKQVMEEAIECGDTHNLKADADMLLRLTQKP